MKIIKALPMEVEEDSCKEHKKRNELCYIRIGKWPKNIRGIVKESKQFHAVADYDKNDKLIGIEFYEGIPIKLIKHKRKVKK